MIVISFPERWGLIPTFLDETDPRPAAEQIAERYAYGGWQPRDWFGVGGSEAEGLTLTYPDDPPRPEVARMQFRDETLILFHGSWVMIRQPDGIHEISRLD